MCQTFRRGIGLIFANRFFRCRQHQDLPEKIKLLLRGAIPLFVQNPVEIFSHAFRTGTWRVLFIRCKKRSAIFGFRLTVSPEKRQFRRIRRTSSVSDSGTQKQPFTRGDAKFPLPFKHLQRPGNHINEFPIVDHPCPVPPTAAGDEPPGIQKLKSPHALSPLSDQQPPPPPAAENTKKTTQRPTHDKMVRCVILCRCTAETSHEQRPDPVSITRGQR